MIIVALAFFVLLPGKDTPAAKPVSENKPDTVATTTSAAPVEHPGKVAEKFLDYFAAQRFENAAALTDDPNAARAQLSQVVQDLHPTSIKTTATALPPDTASGQVDVQFEVAWSFDTRVWQYGSGFAMARSGDRWLVHWAPTLVHPDLAAGDRLAFVAPPDRAPALVDRDGKPVLGWQGATAQPVDPAFAPLLTTALRSAAGGGAGSGGGARIVRRDAAGKELENLFGETVVATDPVKTTLSVRSQSAAQAAVDSVDKPAYLVAIDAPTGGILAVAQNSAAGGAPKALNGLFPPGSTFKVATATAAMAAGKATANTPLNCPASAVISTRAVHNAGNFDLGTVPLHKAFAESCNTTFAALAAGLPANSLPDAAAQFGLAADFEIPGLSTQTGHVRPAQSGPEQVENSIGQGTVQASPFGLALMAATVDKGAPVTPQLFPTKPTVVKSGYRGPSAGTVSALRSMMREVVTAGTGRALAGYGPVAGKTGTAQFGDGSQAHGWFAGYRGDVAFAILVEDGGASSAAVAVTGRFLAAAG